MMDWLEDLRKSDPVVAALIDRQMEVERAEYAALMEEGRAKWGPDFRIVAWTPSCTDPSYRGILPKDDK